KAQPNRAPADPARSGGFRYHQSVVSADRSAALRLSAALRCSMDDWPFEDPENVATWTEQQVIHGGQPILRVAHADDDEMGPFLTGGPVAMAGDDRQPPRRLPLRLVDRGAGRPAAGLASVAIGSRGAVAAAGQWIERSRVTALQRLPPTAVESARIACRG